MPVVDLLELLVAAQQLRHFGLQVPDLGSHARLLLLQLQLVLLQPLHLDEVSFEEDAVPVVEVGFAFLVEALVDFKVDEFLA